MSILSVDNISPIGSGTSVTVNSAATLVVNNANSSGVVTATTFSGSGASLTNLPAGQLTGTVADARITTLTASKLTGALPAIDGSNLTGISAGGSDYVHISNTTISSSVATIEITLPTGYDKFEFMFNFYSAGRAHLYFSFSEDDGSSYIVNNYKVYSQNNSYGYSMTSTSTNYNGPVMVDRSKYIVGSLKIFRASETSDTQFISFCSGFDGGSYSGTIQSAGGMSTAQSARINKVQFKASGSYTFDSGKISLYGIKDS